jgi:hypothetical protein
VFDCEYEICGSEAPVILITEVRFRFKFYYECEFLLEL